MIGGRKGREGMKIMAYFHISFGQDAAGAAPVIRKIEIKDIREALEEGLNDFWVMPSHAAFLGLVYPLCGMVLAYAPSYQNALQLLFPLASGFALVGPFAAVGLYEMSRRRELGLEISWKYAFNVLRSPSIPSIAALGALLLTIFAAWIISSQWLYTALYGPTPPAVFVDFLQQVASTERGWLLVSAGCFIGFCFAAVTLAVSVVSFPLLLDRDARRAHSGRDFHQDCTEEPGSDGALGPHCGGGAIDWRAAVLHRSHPRCIVSRPRYLASLPQSHRSRSRPGAPGYLSKRRNGPIGS